MNYRDFLSGGEEAHYTRYIFSAEWIAPLMAPGITVLDCGSDSAHAHPFLGLIRQCWPEVIIHTTGGNDLRYDLPIQDDTFDLVLCMEVVEHLKDRETSDRATFSGSGITSLFSNIYRVLKPGGRLFLSTPNLSCYHSIERLLQMKHPYFFQPHHREMTWENLSKYLVDAGFNIERGATLDVWEQHSTTPEVVAQLESFMRGAGYSVGNRQDCIFLIAGKHND